MVFIHFEVLLGNRNRGIETKEAAVCTYTAPFFASVFLSSLRFYLKWLKNEAQNVKKSRHSGIYDLLKL